MNKGNHSGRSNSLLHRGRETAPAVYPAAVPDSQNVEAGWASEYLTIIRAHWGKILALGVAGALAGTIYMLRQPVLYRAATTIEIMGLNESFMNLNASDPQAGTGSYSNSVINIQTQMKLLQSHVLLGRVYGKMQAQSVPLLHLRRERFDDLRRLVGVKRLEPAGAFQSALATAAETVSAQPVAGTRLIEISCQSTTPDVASAFVNALAAEFIEQTMQNRLKNLQKTSEWLADQVEHARIKLEQAEEKLQAFARRSGNALTTQETLSEVRLRQLQTDLAALQADRIAKQSRYQMAISGSPEGQAAVMQDGTLAAERTQLAALKRQLAELSSTLAPEHFKVKRIEAQIAEAEQSIANQKQAVIAQIKSEYETAVKREQMLTSAYGRQTQSVISQESSAADMAKYKRDVDLARSAHNLMLQQLNQVGIASVVPTNNIRIVDPGEPPNKPFKPSASVYTGWGLVVGLAMGFIAGLVIEQTHRNIRQPGQSSALLQARELGVIPSATGPVMPRLSHMLTRRKQPVSRPLISSAEGQQGESTKLVTWDEAMSFAAESFRTTLTSMLLEDARGRRPKVIVLTSPAKHDGKTTVCSNLAIAVSETGKRAVLIDGDLRQPRLHRIFGISNAQGLTTILNSSKPIADYKVEELATCTRAGGPYVLPSGPVRGTISQILHNPRLGELIRRLRIEFDVVLIDTPPALAFSDARIFGRLAEGAVLIVRAHKTDINGMLLVRQGFLDDRTPFIGTILNDWNPKDGGSYYQSYHDSYQSYMQVPE